MTRSPIFEMNKFDKMVKSAELNDLVEQTIGKLN